MNSNGFYRAFEERLRGPRELILQRLAVYLPFVSPFDGLYVPTEAIDLGCGRGEWLELLREQGIAARGVDLDEGMLQACRERKLPVEHGDALVYLAGLADDSQCIVSGFHFAEHIAFDDLRTLAAEALRVLKPGGLLILETPNPENVLVGAHRFYLDPTHERPLPPLLLSFTAEHAGFARVKTVRLQEPAGLAASSETRLLDVFEGVSPDYAVVAQKRAAPLLMQRFDGAFAKTHGLELAQLAIRFEQKVEQRVVELQHAAADAAVHAAAESARLGWVDERLREQIEPGFEQLTQAHTQQAADVQRLAHGNAQQAVAVERLAQQQARFEAVTERLDHQQRSQAEALEHLPVALGAVVEDASAAQATALQTHLSKLQAQQVADVVRWRRLITRLGRRTTERLDRLERQWAEATPERALVTQRIEAQTGLLQALQQRADEQQNDLVAQLESIELQMLQLQRQRVFEPQELLGAMHPIGPHQQAAEQDDGAAVQRLNAELQAMRASWSWRLTAPLRWALGLLVQPGATARGLANRTIGHSIERFQRPLAGAMRGVLRNPERGHRINRMLLRFPALHGHLVAVAGRHGVIANGPVQAGAKRSYDAASLSPRASEIFGQLKTAIDIEQEKASR